MPPDTPVPAPAPGIKLVYADEALIVLDKPSGLLSVPGRGPDKQDCLSARVQAQFSDALVVHRLDMATSGLMVMARSAPVQRAMSEAFANRLVTKRYQAVVQGEMMAPADSWRVIDLPIGVDWPNRPLRCIDPLGGKASITRVQLIQFDAPRAISHVLLEPLTGRTHQLRLHLQAVGHPILGDALYANANLVALSPRLMLHAVELGFVHPVSGLGMQFSLERLKYPGEPHTKR